MLQRRLPRLLALGRRLSDATAPAAAGEAPEWARAPLEDLHGRRHDYLRISLTERCNLRCQYCMPAEGVALSPRAALLSRDELLRAVRVLAALGVRKLRLTGGEPTLRRDLHEIIEELSGVPGISSVTMTTNGLVLTRRLPALARAGLAAVNVSLDSLRPARYERLARRAGLPRALAGLDLALQLGLPAKVNTVLMKGINDDEILDFVEFTKDRDVEVRFIEFMPFSGNQWDDARLVPYRAALRVVLQRHPELRACAPRAHDTARVWQVPGYAGRVGFIASMTQQFCSSCNRLRITADGNLKVCLFGNAEVSLRDALRAGADDAALAGLVRAALRNKKPQHAGESPSHVHRSHSSPPPRPPSRRKSLSPQSRGSYSVDIFRNAESGADGEPADDSDRRVGGRRRRRSLYRVPFTAPRRPRAWRAAPLRAAARGLCTRAGDSGAGAGAGSDSDSDSDSDWDCDAGADGFSHLDARGQARMVDVGGKPATSRVAVAGCRLLAGARLLRLLRGGGVPKGDALGVARVAGVMAAKRAAELLPLCHALPLDCVRVSLRLPAAAGAVRVRCEVRATARTGAEMEALAGAAGAALALYDMCKAVDRDMVISDLRVLRKSGGKSDYPPPASDADGAPSETADGQKETFAPINFAYL